MMITDDNWQEICVAYVNAYLSIVGDSREDFLSTIQDLSEQSVPDRFYRLLTGDGQCVNGRAVEQHHEQ